MECCSSCHFVLTSFASNEWNFFLNDDIFMFLSWKKKNVEENFSFQRIRVRLLNRILRSLALAGNLSPCRVLQLLNSYHWEMIMNGIMWTYVNDIANVSKCDCLFGKIEIMHEHAQYRERGRESVYVRDKHRQLNVTQSTIWKLFRTLPTMT